MNRAVLEKDIPVDIVLDPSLLAHGVDVPGVTGLAILRQREVAGQRGRGATVAGLGVVSPRVELADGGVERHAGVVLSRAVRADQGDELVSREALGGEALDKLRRLQEGRRQLAISGCRRVVSAPRVEGRVGTAWAGLVANG